MKNICKQCPYRKDSAPGYLGEASFNPELFLTQLDLPRLHPCHMTVNWESGINVKEAKVCQGAIQFAKNTCKMLVDKEAEKIRRDMEIDSLVFERRSQFIEHHTKK